MSDVWGKGTFGQNRRQSDSAWVVNVAWLMRLFGRLALLCVAVAFFGFVQRALAQNNQAGLDFFENRIRPQLAEHCYDCHSANAKKVKGGLKLDTWEDVIKGGNSGPAIVPGDPNQSLLIKAIRHEDQDLHMPPSKDGSKKLPDSTIQDFVRWVKTGATYPTIPANADARSTKATNHWSFLPIRSVSPPAVKNSGWPQRPIDNFILASLEAQGIKPALAADRRTLIRRATFDLTGLPPTPTDVDAFVTDGSPNAFAKVVERLLNSPQYGEHWGRHWLDVARYADTAGDTADYPVPVAWRYRNYVIDAFDADKPYDEFLREQIAGDILAEQGPRERYAERITATGFVAVSRRFGFDSENYHHLTIQDTIDTVGQTVLGLSLGCARCHNHKFDPISTSEYYGLYGIFESTRYAFPGSEQKAKYRALAPLLPQDEARARWRGFEARFAALGLRPDAVLRSLQELDGDFEMQAAAAGGSKGVLVPPWTYEGDISVSPDAQSPFRNLHPFGKVGASVPGGTNQYALGQSLHPGRTRERGGVMHVNLDFRTTSKGARATGNHRFWLGSRSAPAVELFISADAVELRSGSSVEKIRALRTKQWYNLELAIDLTKGSFSGAIGAPGDIINFKEKAFHPGWGGVIDFIGLDSQESGAAELPGLAIDNIGVQETAFLSVSSSAALTPPAGKSGDAAELNRKFQELVEMDGDFESQNDAQPPGKPWAPGPNSVVKISSSAQSPFRNLFGPGKRGIHIPRTPGYNGFGQTLTNTWEAAKTEHLYTSFDFCYPETKPGESGSWRFYAGHGPGSSAAVELFFNSSQFFSRSGQSREVVQSLRAVRWYQVQLHLNLKSKTYQGTITTPAESTEFTGKFADGWDGRVDYTFIDSYGHLPGVKPALDVDNYIVGETPTPRLNAPSIEIADDSKREKARALRLELAQREAETEKLKRELSALLAEGPFELAYGVAEGTPHNARLQVRGEPDRPGAEVPRGFLRVLGGGGLPQDCAGSGRLELAQWLANPTNPLTARVMVNRIWQYHFAQGLVKTPNDFGTRGQPPTHPELLDYLATQFIRSGWSIKAMHRLIMLSAAYQQAAASPVTQQANIESFSPFPRTRLSAEEIRDAILFVSGELDLEPGRGHPFPKPTEWSFTQHAPFSAVYDHNKRSVYLMTQRLKRHPFLALFDGPDPNASTAERMVTTVPTQALFFLNDPFLHAKADKFASRLERSEKDEEGQIELAYRLAFGRFPTELERQDARQFLSSYRAEFKAETKGEPTRAGLAALARTLFGSNEFLTVD